MERTPGPHPRHRRPAGACPGELPQRAGVRPGLLRGHRPMGRRRPVPMGAMGGAVPDQGGRSDPEEGPVAGQSADGPADQNPVTAAAGVAAGRRAATQGRRGSHRHRQCHRRRKPVHRRRPGLPTLPPGRVRPGLCHRPGRRPAAGPHPRGVGGVLVVGDGGSVATPGSASRRCWS